MRHLKNRDENTDAKEHAYNNLTEIILVLRRKRDAELNVIESREETFWDCLLLRIRRFRHFYCHCGGNVWDRFLFVSTRCSELTMMLWLSVHTGASLPFLTIHSTA